MDRPDLESVATDLGFDLPSDAIANCLAAADELRERSTSVATATSSEGSVERHGSRIDDDHGALLDGYDDPRERAPDPDTDRLLAGTTVVVKDNIATAGLELTCGSDGFSHVPDFDAAVVDALLESGAGLLGKANMDAFAFGPSGEFSRIEEVRNPLDAARIPGGSSSGSGAAVAAGTVDAALGTDTGGSVRIPAACCGIVGIKPTYGTVPTHGVVPFAPSLDTVGPLARDLETADAVRRSIQAADRRDLKTGPSESAESAVDVDGAETISFGVPTQFLERCSAAVIERFDALRAEIEAETDATVESVSLPLGVIEEAYFLIGSTEFAWYIRQRGTVRGVGSTYSERWSRAFGEFVDECGFSDPVAERVLPAAALDATEAGAPYVAGRREAMAFDRRLREAFAAVDCLLLPTIRSLPPRRGAVTAHEGVNDLLGNTAPFNLTGNPAVSVPADAVDGLPVSAQIVAPRYEDALAVTGAATVERTVERSSDLEPPALDADD